MRPSYDDPVNTYAVNVMGTVHFLEAVKQTPSVGAAVVVTSDKCYENRECPRGYREGDPLGGSDPYSSSKGCAELVTDAYRRSFFADDRVGLASVRAGNVIGGGDWAVDRLVPDMVKAFASGQCLRLRHPKAVRPWQHVLDPLCGYLAVAERLFQNEGTFARAWNFGPPAESNCTVEGLVRLAAKVWGDDTFWQVDSEPNLQESDCLRLDSSSARKHLGWVPRLALGTALQWTLAWYRDYEAGKRDMHEFTLKQLRCYERSLES